jgi:hypothetical protein
MLFKSQLRLLTIIKQLLLLYTRFHHSIQPEPRTLVTERASSLSEGNASVTPTAAATAAPIPPESAQAQMPRPRMERQDAALEEELQRLLLLLLLLLPQPRLPAAMSRQELLLHLRTEDQPSTLLA